MMKGGQEGNELLSFHNSHIAKTPSQYPRAFSSAFGGGFSIGLKNGFFLPPVIVYF